MITDPVRSLLGMAHWAAIGRRDYRDLIQSFWSRMRVGLLNRKR